MESTFRIPAKSGGVLFVVGALVARWTPLATSSLILGALCLCVVLSGMEQRRRAYEERSRLRLEAEERWEERENMIGQLKLSPRELELVSELDSRMFFDSVFRKVYDRYHDRISRWLGFDVLNPLLHSICPFGPIEKLYWRKFELGDVAPRITRVVSTRLASPDQIELVLDVEHEGSRPNVELAVRLGSWSYASTTLHFALTAMSLVARVFLRVTMCDRSPFVGVLDFGFVTEPETFDFRLGMLASKVDVTGLLEIGPMIVKALKRAISDTLVFPNKISLPLDEWMYPSSVAPRVANGVLRLRVERALDLPGADSLGYSSPYVVISLNSQLGISQVFKTAPKLKNGLPVWKTDFSMLIHEKDSINIRVMNYDTILEHELLGTATVPDRVLRDLLADESSSRALWIQLDPPPFKNKLKRRQLPARLKIELDFSILTPEKHRFKALDDVADGVSANQEVESPTVKTRDEEDHHSYDTSFIDGEALLDLDHLQALHRRGSIAVKSGYVRREKTYGGVKTSSKRWLELILSLEYVNNTTMEPYVTLRYFSEEADENLSEDTKSSCNSSPSYIRFRKRRRTVEHRAGIFRKHGETRLLSGDKVEMTSTSNFKIKTSSKMWRFRSEDASTWVVMIQKTLKSQERIVALAERAASIPRRPVEPDVEGKTVVVEIFQAHGFVTRSAQDRTRRRAAPYVELELFGQSYRSSTVMNDFEPSWCEHAELWAGDALGISTESGCFKTTEKTLKLRIVDEKSGDTELAVLHVPLKDLPSEITPEDKPPPPQWYALEPPGSKALTNAHRRIRSFFLAATKAQQQEEARTTSVGEGHASPHGEILLRITLRKFALSRVEGVEKVSSSLALVSRVHRLAQEARERTATRHAEEVKEEDNLV